MSLQTDTDPIPPRIGPYTIQRRIGRGAMAEVFEGYDEAHSRRVAIKLLSADLAGDADALQRIERESRILELMRNPHTAQLLGHGRTDDGRPYLVFELVLGHTLAEIIRDHNEPDWETGLKWMTQAAEALEEAWKNHIIHRDIKPGNMIIDAGGNLRLVDFGLAKALHSTPEDESKQRIVLGTPRYISPEMALGQSLDFRADMYSLGATFYHLFLRQAPFDAPSLPALVMAHATRPLPRPHTIDPELPHDICDILEKLLEKEPGKRYQDYADLVSDLREARLALLARNGTPPPGAGFQPALHGHPELADLRLTDAPNAPRRVELRPLAARPEVGAMPPLKNPYRALAWLMAGSALLALVLVGLLVANRQGNSPTHKNAKPPNLGLPKIKILAPLDAPRVRADDLATENRDRMERVMSIIIRYEMEHDRLPASLDQLVHENLASKELVLDAWGRVFRYDSAEGRLRSAGTDGVLDTDDDFLLNTDLKFEREPREPALP